MVRFLPQVISISTVFECTGIIRYYGTSFVFQNSESYSHQIIIIMVSECVMASF